MSEEAKPKISLEEARSEVKRSVANVLANIEDGTIAPTDLFLVAVDRTESTFTTATQGQKPVVLNGVYDVLRELGLLETFVNVSAVQMLTEKQAEQAEGEKK